MAVKRVEVDEHLISAGQCFMFLCWVESTMRDFVVLADCSEEIRNAYSHAYGNKDHPSDFALERLRRARFSFGRIKEQFVAHRLPCPSVAPLPAGQAAGAVRITKAMLQSHVIMTYTPRVANVYLASAFLCTILADSGSRR